MVMDQQRRVGESNSIWWENTGLLFYNCLHVVVLVLAVVVLAVVVLAAVVAAVVVVGSGIKLMNKCHALNSITLIALVEA